MSTGGLAFFLMSVSCVLADGPGDNIPEKVRRIPPPGVEVPAAVRAELQAGVEKLGQAVLSLRETLKSRLALLELLPDIVIYCNAVRYALTCNEFFDTRELEVAKALLRQGQERAKLLRDGKAPWSAATGLVVRGSAT